MRVLVRFAAITGGLMALAFPGVAAPTVATRIPAPKSTVRRLTTISVRFKEAVTGVDAADLLINGESAVRVKGSGPGPYVFTFTQPAAGHVSVSWEYNHGIAGLGTGNFVPREGWSYMLEDTVRPGIAKVRTSIAGRDQAAIVPLPGSVVTNLTQAEVLFSEPVTGVDAPDLRIRGKPAHTVTGSGAGPYVFTFAQPRSGRVAFSWAQRHGIKDTSARRNSFVRNSWAVKLNPKAGRDVLITEFLAANATSILDEDSDPSGWIEIYNRGSATVNLAGWGLSNDEDNSKMWVFPARTLPPNRRLVLFASGKDRKPAKGNLHTNFRLSPNGGFVGLSPPESASAPVSSYDPYPVQRYDYSYGEDPGGSLRYFERSVTGEDTRPGSPNPASTLVSVTPSPTASVSRGIFNQPFAVTLSCPDSTATIRYTLDGSEPLAGSAEYTQPLSISSTTLLRVAAFGVESIPSETVTHSYIFTDQVTGQASPPYDNPDRSDDDSNLPLPSIGGARFPIDWGTRGEHEFPGLVTNLPEDTVPADYGMDPEVYGDSAKFGDNGLPDNVSGKTNLERIRQSYRELPVLSVVLNMDDIFGPHGIYPNFTQKTPPVEKPCSVELLLPDGSGGFAVPCGIRPHGNSSRNPESSPKHSFKLKLKGDFGAANLEYRLFADSAAAKFDNLVLRADYDGSWIHEDSETQALRGTRQRDAWSKHTFRDMGREAGHHRYVHLFINGLYWGTYDVTEEPDENFARNHYGGEKEDYDVVEQAALKSGSMAFYNSMVDLADSGDFERDATYERMKGFLDVPQFIDYMLLHFYNGHEDWGTDITKNWYAIRNAKKNGTFKYLPWDQENILYSEITDQTGVATPPSGLQTKLIDNAQYRLDFADRVNRHMLAPDGALTPAANSARWNYWRDLLRNSLVAESARWGDYRRDVDPLGPSPLYTWNQHAIAEHNRLTGTYFPQRTEIVMAQLRSRGLYPVLNAPELRANSDSVLLGRQRVAAGFQVKMQLPEEPLPDLSTNGNTGATEIYYTTDGTDPRVYYAGTIATTAQVYSAPITVNGTTTIKARTYDSVGEIWSALNDVTLTVDAPLIPKIRLTELMYNPAGGTAYEFIEFQNAGTEPVNMSGWYLDGVEFVFPGDTILEPGSRLVIASNDNPVEWATRYPGVVALGNYGGSLNNAGERITLYDRAGRIVVSVDYDDGAPWPTAADGSGYSLELASIDGDPDSPFSWRSSNAVGGSAGLENGGGAGSSVQISEVLAINAGAVTNAGLASSFIELRNAGGSAVNLTGWRVVIGGALYTIPGGTTIAANGFLVIWLDNGTGGTGLHAGGLVLSGSGSGVRLFDATNPGAVDQVAYGQQVADRSIGRIAGSWQLTNPTPGSENSGAETAALNSIALNEWLANQGSGDVADWVELHNRDGSLPVPLGGLYLQAGSKIAQLQQLSFLKPGGFLRLFAGEGAQQIDLTLPASGTTLELFSATGDFLESVTISPAAPGVTEGRFPDGAAAFFSFGFNATPGAPNVLINGYDGPLLNELLVVNVTREESPWGARVPWLELHNPGDAAFDLSGFGLATRREAPAIQIYRFPAGTIIPAQGSVVVWFGTPPNGQAIPPGTLNMPATLLPGGGALYLLNVGGGVVDSVEWGSQAADLSIGRVSGVWRLLASTTAGNPNSAAASLGASSSLKLNEWLAAPASGSDFIELFNTSGAPVELTGLYLTDDPSAPGLTKYQVPPLSFIAPQGWARFIATSNPPANPDAQTNFALEAEGEYLRLSAPDLSLIDAISFGQQTTGRSEGRFPDGDNIVIELIPTPGGSNMVPAPPMISAHPDLRVRGMYDRWRVSHFNTGELNNGAVSGAAADADRDGLSNLQEFFHGLDPRVGLGEHERSALPQIGVEPLTGTPRYVTLTFRRSARAEGITAELECCGNLSSGCWKVTAPSMSEELAPDPLTGDRRVRWKVPIGSGETRKFFRLKLTLSQPADE